MPNAAWVCQDNGEQESLTDRLNIEDLCSNRPVSSWYVPSLLVCKILGELAKIFDHKRLQYAC